MIPPIIHIHVLAFDSIFLLSTIFVFKNDFEKAKGLMIKAVEIQPENKSALNNLGIAYKELGQLEEAINRTFFNHDEGILDSRSFYEYEDEDDITLEEIIRDVDLNITFGDFVEACVKGTKNQLSSLLNIIFSPKKP